MVPWLPEWEPAGSLFGEDIEIGMVAGGNKLLGSVHWFLRRWGLNLGLMDEFKAVALSLLVKRESFGAVLE